MSKNLETVAKDGKAHIWRIDNLPDDALCTVQQIRPLIGNPSNPTLWRWVSAGDFPKPARRTGPAQQGTRLWRVGDIRKWLSGEWQREQAA